MQKQMILKAVTGIALAGLITGCATTREAAWSGEQAGTQAQEAEEGSGADDALAALAAEADAAWNARSDHKQAEQAIAKWTELVQQQPSAETYVKISRALFPGQRSLRPQRGPSGR